MERFACIPGKPLEGSIDMLGICSLLKELFLLMLSMDSFCPSFYFGLRYRRQFLFAPVGMSSWRSEFFPLRGCPLDGRTLLFGDVGSVTSSSYFHAVSVAVGCLFYGMSV